MTESRVAAGREGAADEEVEILLLGTVEARRRGRSVHLQGKQRTLLAALALEANHVVPDDRLIELLWPGEPPDTATDSLRVHMSKLRRAMEDREPGVGGPERRLLERKATGYQLTIPTDHIDLVRCRHLVAEARQLVERGDDAGALQLLDEAARLWRGDPLVEFGDEPFALGERSHLEKLRLETLEQRFDVSLRLGLHAQVVGELEALAVRYPLHERLQELLMLALYQCGRQAEASDVYHRTRRRLSEDLGMEPGPGFQARFREILNQDPAVSPATHQPPPRPGNAEASAKRHNLPAQMSSFVGREASIAGLRRTLREERLVTLLGPGGIGKTRLALEVGRALVDEFPDGVWLTDLLAVGEHDLVEQAVLMALGLRQLPGMSPFESVAAVLEDRSLLLILDNCEHIIDAAARTAEGLLRVSSGLTILATSRERLGIAGELGWPVAPLTLPEGERPPPADRLLEYEAVRLFVERARMVRPSFEIRAEKSTALIEVCARLDGIPLALELAAARMAALGLDDLIDRLADRFRLLAGGSRVSAARHRTLRETLDWSITLLSEAERTLFFRLGVFAGTFTLAAAEAVCSDVVLPREEIAGLMGRLVDKSLVVFDGADFGDSRYRLLETMREYALERLSGAGGHVLRKRHALHYLERGRECERLYFDAQANAARVRYDADYINARAALEWSHGVEPELCLDIAAAWRFYWFLQGLLGEGRAWLELALDSPAGQDAARARALSGLGRLIAIQGDLERAIHIFSEGLLLAEHAGDDFMVGELTNSLGIATVDGAGNVKAEAYFRRAVEIWERVGYQEGLATAYGNLGEMAFYAGKHDEARGLFTKQVEMGREISRYYGWVNLSHLDCFLGNFRAARKSAAEALRVAPPLYAAVVIEVFAFLAAAQEQAERAATLSASAARLYAMRGARADPTAHREVHEARLREVIGRLDDRALAAARQRAAEMPLDEVTAYALAEA